MRIYLRPVTEDDADMIVKWRNAEKIRNHCFDKKIITIDDNKEFFERNIVTGKYRQYIVMRVEEISGVASYPIATIYLKDIDMINRRCELCIFTSDDEEWNTESQRIAINIMLELANKELNMHKVYSYVFVDNNDPVELFTEVGFKKEAILEKEAVFVDGSYGDVLRLSVILD